MRSLFKVSLWFLQAGLQCACQNFEYRHSTIPMYIAYTIWNFEVTISQYTA